ncbi:MAG: NADH-quinone oxidoreductase subunit L [bacterium]|nr:MAG: NADH-quinone oxidoreductase subunit L [bacterium]
MHELLYPIVIPAIAGAIPLFIPRRGKMLAGLISLVAAVWLLWRSIGLFGIGELNYSVTLFSLGEGIPFEFTLRLYHFSAFIILFTAIFGVLIILYSLGYLRGRDTSSTYYSFVLWTLSAAVGAVLTDNLLVLLIFWEILTALLYFLVNLGTEGHEKAAAKCFLVLGFSDAAVLLGVLLIWVTQGTLTMSALEVSTGTPLGVIAFVLVFIGAIAKAGAMPLHSWIPEMAVPTPASIIAFLPASLDKLLGIYLLARISLDIFVIQTGSGLSMMMMIIGSATIIFAVLMALVQHNLKKLLSFHAISQVGYMVLGVGSGIPIAIVGGLFHMLNHAIYKSGLFLGAGAVEKRAGTTELDELGGLARLMPITFVTMIITAFSISGVPPFNGFVSKWLVYQGMLEGGHLIFLVAAIFGSALTLASFIKVLHSLFLGRRPQRLEKVREVDFSMQLPMVFLALLCVLFGVFARYPLERFIIPVVGGSEVGLVGGEIATTEGFWSPTLATALIIIGVVVGLIIYAFGRTRKVREDENVWVGGNVMDSEEIRIPGTHFYKTISEEVNPVFSAGFRDGQQGALDFYNVWGRLGMGLVNVLRTVHNGILSTYLSWAVIGLGILAFILMFR